VVYKGTHAVPFACERMAGVMKRVHCCGYTLTVESYLQDSRRDALMSFHGHVCVFGGSPPSGILRQQCADLNVGVGEGVGFALLRGAYLRMSMYSEALFMPAMCVLCLGWLDTCETNAGLPRMSLPTFVVTY
jgi:hypothetical protein